jgi:hypothetical protein
MFLLQIGIKVRHSFPEGKGGAGDSLGDLRC